MVSQLKNWSLKQPKQTKYRLGFAADPSPRLSRRERCCRNIGIVVVNQLQDWRQQFHIRQDYKSWFLRQADGSWFQHDYG